ncbi:hypothetical protein [Streptomyces sp. VRA16 Mangrove soil]|uniref:hypothetical protein n=1 Tax=Streptomyces sp. VRA16 Mangrove soil TaxID=2817434 RepID=UPI001A9FCC5C|nr:hypothetical protein [Streptomyces sp. VRA16 Mangrove soil]MBO1335582.1 hypothetical protein [Streptomyces sp. VRA16 Mangrove soil]
MNGTWLTCARDGRLCVHSYAADAGAVVCRVERAPGGPWTDPRTVGGDQRVHPALALARSAERYTHLVTWRPTTPGESGLVHSTHFQPHLSALDWTPIGHPNKKGDRTGDPAVAVDAQGRAHVFVRNLGGGVSMRAQLEKGGWGPWRDLKGKGVRGRLAAVAGESGLIVLHAATAEGLLRWRQEEAGEPPVLDDKPLPAAVRPDSPHALATSSEEVTLFYVDEDGGLYAWRGDADPVRVLDAAGPGQLTAIRSRLDGVDCTLLAQRAASGRLAFAAYPTQTESAGAWWAESGDPLPADTRIALTEDGQGRVVAGALVPGAPDRMLLTRRNAEPGLALEAWRQVF